jgi:hypothetical protein
MDDQTFLAFKSIAQPKSGLSLSEGIRRVKASAYSPLIGLSAEISPRIPDAAMQHVAFSD